ncbi:MAG: hypothetical protein IIB08_04960, partial [Bacteroidetes bacterium]|nr:hypothetical protein [Bacteroidota bacterium]
ASAGGSVWLIIAGNITGAGTISADGGDSSANSAHGAGAGGRIAIEYGGTTSLSAADLSASGGANTLVGGGVGSSSHATSGTIYVEGPSHANEQGNLTMEKEFLLDDSTNTEEKFLDKFRNK